MYEEVLEFSYRGTKKAKKNKYDLIDWSDDMEAWIPMSPKEKVVEQNKIRQEMQDELDREFLAELARME